MSEERPLYRSVSEISLWATVALLAIGGVATYVRFETQTQSFIVEATPIGDTPEAPALTDESAPADQPQALE